MKDKYLWSSTMFGEWKMHSTIDEAVFNEQLFITAALERNKF